MLQFELLFFFFFFFLYLLFGINAPFKKIYLYFILYADVYKMIPGRIVCFLFEIFSVCINVYTEFMTWSVWVLLHNHVTGQWVGWGIESVKILYFLSSA